MWQFANNFTYEGNDPLIKAIIDYCDSYEFEFKEGASYEQIELNVLPFFDTTINLNEALDKCVECGYLQALYLDFE